MEKIKVTRRSFLIGMTFTTAGVVFSSFGSLVYGKKDKNGNVIEGVFQPGIWIEISPDNTIKITVARSEMGQGTRTSMAMIVAEELDADWSKVKVIQAPGDSKYGSQSTAGSQSVLYSYSNLRYAGATARAMLISAAAQLWGIPNSSCNALMSQVSEKSGSRTFTYGELTDKASTLSVPPKSTIKLKSPDTFTIIGQSKLHYDALDMTMGKAVYGLDTIVPDMKYAAIARRPALGASVNTYDDTETMKVPGVIRTMKISEGVAVVADNTYAAFKGVEALKVNWNMGSNTSLDSAKISKSFFDKIGTLPSMPGTTVKTVDAVYEVPFLAHAPMEPMNTTAHFKGTTCELWVPTQSPQSVQNDVASLLSLPVSSVKVNVTLVGGAFGRRNATDYATAAAKISKQMNIPIKLTFSRTDDLRIDYYRPASLHALRGGIDASGNITGWYHKGIYASGGSVYAPPYTLPSPQNVDDQVSTPVPTGPWRSVDSTQLTFANESFLDELAIAASKDPIDFRITLANSTRIKNVLTSVKSRSEWIKPLAKGYGRGVAAYSGYGGVIATVVEVFVDDFGKLKVTKIFAVADPGLAINPKNTEAQIMGAANDALATAMKSQITIDKGQIVQSNFMDFEWLLFDEAPEFDFTLNITSTNPSGMGELGFPSVTPALCNAIFNATGIRVRKLPISGTKLKTSVDEPSKDKGEMKIYPNPFSNDLTIEINNVNSIGDLQIAISDISGREVYQTRAEASDGIFSQRLRLPELSSGEYLINVIASNKSFSGKAMRV